MSDQTNQDPNLQNDDVSITHDHHDKSQKDEVKKPITTHQGGGVEGAPASIESAPKVEDYVETSEPEPKLSEEEEKAGVEKVHEKPKLHPDAKAAGVTHSIPDKPNYNIKESYKSDADAKSSFEKGDTAEANTFRALEYFKNFKKGLLGALKPIGK